MDLDLDPDPDLDPYWPPTSSSGSGSGSVKNEHGSTTLLKKILRKIWFCAKKVTTLPHLTVLDNAKHLKDTPRAKLDQQGPDTA